MKKSQKVLQPQYVRKFQCIGGDCEDSCCGSSWSVFIDKATYKLYKKYPDIKMRRKLEQNVIYNRLNSSDETYAKLKMDAEKGCPFWDEEKLCAIQRDMGERYLSDTCAMYPRNYNIAGDIWEKSLYLSCPEAARLALLNSGMMEFDMTEEEVPARKHNFYQTVAVSDAKKNHTPEQYFSELRVFTISLLQNRLYPLWQRLVILGLFYNNLDRLVAESKTGEILPLITTYLEHLKEGTFHHSLENVPLKPDIQSALMRELTANRAAAAHNGRFVECFNETMRGINYAEELSAEEFGAQYALIYENYYRPFFDKHEYILENYLVNYVFTNLFPFAGKKNVFDNYIMLIVHYSMIKMMLIGMASFHKERFNTEYVLKLIQSFTKLITHDPTYLQSVIDFLRDNKLDNMAHMAILIKN